RRRHRLCLRRPRPRQRRGPWPPRPPAPPPDRSDLMSRTRHTSLALALTLPAIAHAQFASRVVDYAPAPGQFVNDPAFNDPARSLGAPIGAGLLTADLTSIVTLGGFGGSLTLAFDEPVEDDANNPLGLDCIVFGSAFYVAGNENRRWAEAGLI